MNGALSTPGLSLSAGANLLLAGVGQGTAGTASGAYYLDAYVGVISAALRADSSPTQKVNFGGYTARLAAGLGVEDLVKALQKNRVPISQVHVEDDIYQTDDPLRSVVELVSNSLDANSSKIEVSLKNGRLQIKDDGKGMSAHDIMTRLLVPKLSGKPDPSKQNGRFGIGFYTSLRHLKKDGDRVIVRTKAKGSVAYELVFEMIKGKITFSSKEIGIPAEHGTTVIIESSDIKEADVREEVKKYLRYVDEGKVFLNEEDISEVEELKERRRIPEARVLVREGGARRGAAAMKVGGVIIEQYRSEEGSFNGEVVLELPYSMGLTITKDKLVVDEKLISFMEQIISLEEDLSVLNSFVPLVAELDKRNETGKPILEILRKRVVEIGDKLRVYPSWMYGKVQGNVQFVDGRLFADIWWNRFDSPPEWQGGETIEQSGLKKKMRLMLSDELKDAWHYDPENAVLFLSKEFYQTAPTFVLSAFFMIKGLDFAVNWGKVSHSSGILERNDEPSADIEEVKRFLKEEGYSLEDFIFTAEPGANFSRLVNSSQGGILLIKNEFGLFAKFSNGLNDRVVLLAETSEATKFAVVGYAYLTGERYFVENNGRLYELFEGGQRKEIDAGFGDLFHVIKAGGRLFTKTYSGTTGIVSLNEISGDHAVKLFEHDGGSELMEVTDDSSGNVYVKVTNKTAQKTRLYVIEPDGKFSLILEDEKINFTNKGGILLVATSAKFYMVSGSNKSEIPENIRHGISNILGIMINVIDLMSDELAKINSNGQGAFFLVDGIPALGGKFAIAARLYSEDEDDDDTEPLLEYENINPSPFHARALFIEFSNEAFIRVSNTAKDQTQNTCRYIPYTSLLIVAQAGKALSRWNWIKEHRLSPVDCLSAVTHAPDEVWKYLTEHEDHRFRGLLQEIGDDEVKYNYLLRHKKQPFYRVKLAFEMMGAFESYRKNDNEFLAKIEALLNSSIDIRKLISDFKSEKRTHDVEAVVAYMQAKGSEMIPPGHFVLPALNSSAHSLADVVTHLRLGHIPGKKIIKYNNEEDQRQVLHAAKNLYATDPFAFVREMMRFSLAKGRRIDIAAYDVGGQAVVSFRDLGGMTEEEFWGLLKAGEGWFSIMAGAGFVRIKTAAAGAEEVINAEFIPIRDENENIVDIQMKFEKIPNADGFQGTLIESSRTANIAALEGVRFGTQVKDMGRYVSRKRAAITYNGEELNAGRNGALIETDDPELGHVEVYDGLANRLLHGGLPLSALPPETWAKIPDAVKRLYDRVGFYVNLDADELLPSPTRDRLRSHKKVIERLSKVLPALLIKGFLIRISDGEHQEDLRHLPEVYFNDLFYSLAKERTTYEFEDDAAVINEKRWQDFSAEKYSNPGVGERNLTMLMTLVRFFRIEGEDESLSLRDIHKILQRALAGDDTAEKKLEVILRAEVLPRSIAERIISELMDDSFRKNERKKIAGIGSNAEGEVGIKGYELERKYDRSEIESPEIKRYLDLVWRITNDVWLQNGGYEVKVGINTYVKNVGLYADHFASDGTYHLYRTAGQSLRDDAQELDRILSDNDGNQYKKFEEYIAKLFEYITHELTHDLRETKTDATHDVEFYRRQRYLIAGTVFSKQYVESLLKEEIATAASRPRNDRQ